MDVGGVKGQSRNSPFPPRRPHCLPTETPPTVRRLYGALSKHRGQVLSIKGAPNIFYFLKELCEFYVYWQAFENVFNFVMFTNDFLTSYLLK